MVREYIANSSQKLNCTHAITSSPPTFGGSTKVAVIGAGISGVCTAAHALRLGLEVTLFERSSTAGGAWHFDERVATSPSFPSEIASVGDYAASRPGQFAYRTPPPEPASDLLDERRHPLDSGDASEVAIQFAPPGPCYPGLKNNVPTSLMVSSLAEWPDGTPENTSQRDIDRYVQDIAETAGVNKVTLYNTRVEDVKKPAPEGQWQVRTLTFEKRDARPLLIERIWGFDAVVVASGHYNLPRVPDIEGMAEWRRLFGDRVMHSKMYRHPEKYRDKNVLIIGASVSSLDICRELADISNKTYQSSRGGQYDLPDSWLPANAERVDEVEAFVADPSLVKDASLHGQSSIPGHMRLKSGRILTDIHEVIVATGYITSYPFLPQLHSDELSADSATPEVLVTAEGEMCHNLHKDIFYIPDPSLCFVDVPYHIATFSLFDFQAQIVARVLAEKAKLPSEQEMRIEYEERVKSKGLGRGFHSLRAPGAEVDYANNLVDWANRDAELRGGVEPMRRYSKQWLENRAKLKEKMQKLFGSPSASDTLQQARSE